MGWFNSIKEKANKSLGLGKNNDLLNIGAGIMTGGASVLVDKAEKGKIGDLLMGKKEGGKSADAIAAQIKATQTKGLGELNSALDKKSSQQIINQQVAQEKTGILSAAQDARRNAQRMMAQQGLKGTSLGLANQRSIDQATGNQIASVNAKVPGMLRNQQLNDAQLRMSAGGLANAGNIQFQDVEGQRSGGLFGALGAVAPLAGQVAGIGMQYQGMKDQRAFNKGYLDKMK